MAFAAVGQFLSANDKTAGTTIVATASATVEVGNLAAVWVTFDNAQTTDGDSSQLSIADSAGNTWEKFYEKTETSGAANDGVCGALFISKVTSQIDSGSDTVTVTSTSSRTASAIHGYEFTIGAGVTVELADGTAIALSQAATGQPGSITVSGMTSEAHLLLYCYYQEGVQTITGYDTMTDAGSNGTSGGSGNTNVRVEPAYAIATGTSFSCDMTASSGSQWVQVLVALREVSGGQSAAANTATETDTAGTFGRRKTRAAGTPTETDSAPALGRIKTRAVGTPNETNTALALGRRKTRAVGTATETNTAIVITRAGSSHPVGTATETDAALPLGRIKTRAVAVVAETETALPLGRIKAKLVGLVTDAAVALPLGRVKAKLVGLVTDAAVALPLGRIKAKLIGTPTETDTALTITRAGGSHPVGTVTETDVALALGRLKIRAVLAATEIDGQDQIPTVNIGSGLWQGYWIKPAVTSGIADPDGGTGAYRMASTDNVSPPNYSGLLMFYTNAGVPAPVIGEVREVRVWLRAVAGTLAMQLGVDDGHTDAITIDTTWREYRVTKTRVSTAQNRIFEVLEQVAGNTAWEIYQPRSILAKASAIGRNKRSTLGAVLETAVALALGRRKTRAVGTATETDLAVAITAESGATVFLDPFDPFDPVGPSGGAEATTATQAQYDPVGPSGGANEPTDTSSHFDPPTIGVL